jgi:hypothetical protein
MTTLKKQRTANGHEINHLSTGLEFERIVSIMELRALYLDII